MKVTEARAPIMLSSPRRGSRVPRAFRAAALSLTNSSAFKTLANGCLTFPDPSPAQRPQGGPCVCAHFIRPGKCVLRLLSPPLTSPAGRTSPADARVNRDMISC